MSEYFYHKGILKFKPAKAKNAFEQLISTEYGGFANEDGKIQVEGDQIDINTIDLGSFPLLNLTEFHDKLTTLLSDLAEKCELEHYCYNDGYYKITLDPNKEKLLMKWLKSNDPHENDPVSQPGEEVSIGFSQENILEELEEVLPGVDSKKVLDAYYKILWKFLKRGDRVNTPLGTLIKTKSLVEGQGDITVFYWSEEL